MVFFQEKRCPFGKIMLHLRFLAFWFRCEITRQRLELSFSLKSKRFEHAAVFVSFVCLKLFIKPGPNDRNISTQHMHAFGHPVACCEMLRHAGCCWLKFETGQIFHATFFDVACCCSRLARFVQRMRASSIFNTQHVATRCNRVAKRVQQCYDLFC